ncbi:MAG: pyridoxal-dependent decarboxylase, exosortase A system-associated, partial [Sphingopyxis sp.]
MKPHGPIPPGFAADADGMLRIGGRRADALAEAAGDTPLFVYDRAMLTARAAEWRAAMPREVQLHYAMKANPFAPLLAHMATIVDGFDVASGGELALALASGKAAEHISFAGPGKRDRELEAAIVAGATLNLESAGEGARALAIADRIGTRPRLAVRVNPDFDLKGSGMKMGGGAKPFGVDADAVPALVRTLIDAGADWRGFHIFAGSQALDADAIADTQAQTVALAARLAEAVGATPPLVNLGGGMGVPYFPGDRAVDAATVGARLAETLGARGAAL